MKTKKDISKSTMSMDKKKQKIEEQTANLEVNMEKIEKSKQFEDYVEEKKQAIKKDLQNQLIAQDKFGRQFDDMVNDYIYLVELKERLQRDIAINGIRYKTTGGNGFTSYKPNESCERLLKTNAQMLKILQDLDLKAPDEKSKGSEGDDLL